MTNAFGGCGVQFSLTAFLYAPGDRDGHRSLALFKVTADKLGLARGDTHQCAAGKDPDNPVFIFEQGADAFKESICSIGKNRAHTTEGIRERPAYICRFIGQSVFEAIDYPHQAVGM